jgi:hypothetical protein
MVIQGEKIKTRLTQSFRHIRPATFEVSKTKVGLAF